MGMTGTSGSTPKRPWLEAVISALSAVIVIWLGSWGYAALDRTVAAQQQLERAAALADELAAQAGKGQAKEGAAAIEKRGAEIIERVFVTDKGGVDEFGIARGGGVLVGGADLPAEVRQALLNHDKGVIAAAEQAGREKRPLAWARLTTTMEDGRRVIAVPYRVAADKAPAGVSGFILRSAPASAGNQAWVWLAPLLAAGLILLLGATRPISAGLGAAAQVLVVATVFLSAPAALTVTEATGDVVGALLFPHAGPPVNEALNTASWWLLGALLLLAGALGAACSS